MNRTVLKLAAICAIPLAYFVFLFFSIGRDIQTSMDQIRQSRFEATAAINHIYAYFEEHGRWPTESEVAAPANKWLPAGWHYGGEPELPTLYNQGTCHMSIVYEFKPPQQGAVNETWTLSFEGDQSQFPAGVVYVLPPGKAQHAKH